MSNELSRKQKIEFIEKQGINYKEIPNSSVDSLFRLAITKDFISERLSDKLECFGFIEDKDPTCSKCFLAKNGSCSELKKYNESVRGLQYSDKSIKVGIRRGRNEVFVMENIDVYLAKLRMRETRMSYKVAKIILESDNVAFGEMLKRISDLFGENIKITYAKNRFYSVRSIIQRKTDLKIGILTQKYVHIMKNLEKEK